MLQKVYKAIFGDYNEKQVKELRKQIPAIRAHQAEFAKLTDDELRAQFVAWKAEYSENPAPIYDDMNVREKIFGAIVNAAERLVGTKYDVQGKEETWAMVHYDVQLVGGLVLSSGKIGEMKTGEGKTLVSTLPVILHALTGRGVHVITVNDYLASRDGTWMSPLFDFCGLTYGCIIHGKTRPERKAAYDADITYGTNNEFGFDYLRDNMAQSLDHIVQRDLHFAIVDEVDSILIDEARTPLIISAPAGESTDKYMTYAGLVNQLQPETHYVVEARTKGVTLTEEGISKMESLLGIGNIYTEAGFDEVHHIENALKARVVFERDKDYLVADGKVMIVDEFTGRLMPGRRYSDGLHQALEAKEGVDIQQESKTLATITFQNYFRLYEKLSGMTGTAETEAEEFAKIYKLDTIVIPTNRPIARQDLPDKIFKNVKGKYIALAKEVKNLNKKGQPVLVGTVSVEKSEVLSELLKREGVKHEVLNAKQHEREAEIVTNAGQLGAVTIATNMAGRGTDIKITDAVRELGGLAILGTERHESRRIDNQLRGRAGRQGDAGFSQFYVSMTDELMRRFGGERLANIMEKMGLDETEAIESGQLSRQVESAQKKIEGFHFDARKHVVQYDDIMNVHREKVYARRRTVLHNEDILSYIDEMITTISSNLIAAYIPSESPDANWDTEGLHKALTALHHGAAEFLPVEWLEQAEDRETISGLVEPFLKAQWEQKLTELPEGQIQNIARYVVLKSIDELWLEHINTMTSLRDRVALSGYAQKDPVMEYKREAFLLFKRLLDSVSRTAFANLLRVHVRAQIVPQVPREDLETNQAEIEETLTNTAEFDKQKIDPYAGGNEPQKRPELSRRARRQMKRDK